MVKKAPKGILLVYSTQKTAYFGRLFLIFVNFFSKSANAQCGFDANFDTNANIMWSIKPCQRWQFLLNLLRNPCVHAVKM